MKKFLLLMLSLCLICSMIGCSKGDADSEPNNGTTLSATEWEAMLSDDVFSNYTVVMEGQMSVTENGVSDGQGKENLKETIKVTNDRFSIEAFIGDEPLDAMVLDGEIAAVHKEQASQLFLAMLSKYDAYSYDKASDTYKISEPITIEATMKGLKIDDTGAITTFDVPSVIEMRNAEAKVSDNGRIVSFVCDYSQSMTVNGKTVGTSGLTTWTFSNFGTTVIESPAN